MAEFISVAVGSIIMLFFITVMVFMTVMVVKEAVKNFELNGFDWSDFTFYFILAGSPICFIMICVAVVAYHVF